MKLRAKAKLKEGDLQEAKRYMSQYETLVSGLANKEIKENGRVVVSKQQSNQLAINGLKQLEGLENEYFNKKKQEEITLHNQKINQLKAQLEATKAQLQLEVQRLNLEKELIQLTTGKTIDIDTTPALNSIKNLDNQIKLLDNQIKTAKDYRVDTAKAKATINTFKSDVTKENLKVEVKAEYQKTQQELEGAIKNFESNPVETEIKADTTPAENKVTSFKDIAKNPVDFKLNVNDTEAQKTLNTLQQPISTTLTINVNATEAFKVISQLQQNTSSVHTIYIREVRQKALGGLIEPLKLATGGQTFRRVSGRIAGYDPNDSDDVPALLTRGEFVIKRDAVKYYGDDFLYRLNNKLLPKYATGGLVEWKDPTNLIQETKRDIKNYQTDEKPLRDEKEKEYKPAKPIIDTARLTQLAEKLREIKVIIIGGGGNPKFLQDLDNTRQEITRFNPNYHSNPQQAVKDLENQALNVLDKAEIYTKKVVNIKETIKNKIRTIGVPDDSLGNWKDSMDLEKLEKFYKSIQYAPTLSKYNSVNSYKITADRLAELIPHFKQGGLVKIDNNQIQKLFDELVKKYVTHFREKVLLFAGYSKKLLQLPKAPDGNILLQLLGIKNGKELREKYSNLFNAIDPMQYGKDYNVGSELVSATIKEWEKEHPKPKEDLTKKLPKFKTGGVINGLNGGKLNGYGGGDRNLALLEDGEFIVRKEAVSNYGVELLQKLNNFKLPKFATGGYVGNMPTNSTAPSDLVNVNFNLPNGKSYSLQGSEEVARLVANEFKRMM